MDLTHILHQGDVILIATFLLLIGMSLMSWYVIFWKLWKLRQERQWLNHFARLSNHSADWPRQVTARECQGGVKMLLDTADKIRPHLRELEKPERKEFLDMHLSQTLDGLRTWFDKGLTILASVGSSAPFIGLFGTVWGIYGALTRIAAEGNASLNVVAGPMGEALVATAVGLFAAIPAVLAYNAFVRKNRLLTQDLRHIAEQLSAHVAQEKTSKSDMVRLASVGQ